MAGGLTGALDRQMSIPEPEEFAREVIAAFGGRERFFARMEERLDEFNNVWNQDAERIGRVLRAHLAVEHFLTDYIVISNPNLGSLDDARLSFNQKVDLLSDNDRVTSPLKPGLRRLNQVRNRIAHKLKVDIREEDKKVFLDVAIFKAMRAEGAKHIGTPADDPLSVLEQFSKFAAGMLHSGADPDNHLWKKASDGVQGAVQQSAQADGPASGGSAA